MEPFALILILLLGVSATAIQDSHFSCSTKFGSNFIKYPATKTSTKTQASTLTIVHSLIFAQTVGVYSGAATRTVTDSTTTTTIVAIKTEAKTRTLISNIYATIASAAPASVLTTTLSPTSTLLESTTPNTITKTSTITLKTTVTNLVVLTSTVPMVGHTNHTPFDPVLGEVGIVAYRPEYNNTTYSKRNSKLEYQKKYPQHVDCVRTLVKTVSKIVTTTIKAHPITKAVTTKPFTKSTVKCPLGAFGTINISTSISITSTEGHDMTSTKTATSTVNSVIPVPFNIHCNDDNLRIALYNGDRNSGPLGPEDELQYIPEANNAYQCCVHCFNATTRHCEAGMFKENKCFHRYSNTCRISASNGTASSSTTNGNSWSGLNRALRRVIKRITEDPGLKIIPSQNSTPQLPGAHYGIMNPPYAPDVTDAVIASIQFTNVDPASGEVSAMATNMDHGADLYPTGVFSAVENTSTAKSTETSNIETTANNSGASVPLESDPEDKLMTTTSSTPMETIAQVQTGNTISISTDSGAGTATMNTMSTNKSAACTYVIQHFSGPCH